MELRDYLHVLRRRWRVVAASVLLCIAIAAVLAWTRTPVYAARTQLFVSTSIDAADPSETYQGGLFSQQRVLSYARLVSSPAVLADVIETLELRTTPEQLEGQIRGYVPVDTVLIEIEVTDPSAQRAKEIADAVAVRFSAFVTELEARDDGTSSPVKVSRTREALLPTAPVSPRTPIYLALGLLAGLALGISAAVLRDTLDTRLREDGDPGEALGLPVLGRIANDPQAKRRPLVVPNDPHSPRAEAYRRLRSNLGGLTAHRPLTSFVVSSPREGEGKTVVAANLAVAYAQAGYRVVLVDAELRRPRLAALFGLSQARGLSDALRGNRSVDEALQSWQPGLQLELLASGDEPPNPSELLGSQRFASLMEELQGRSDIVILDAPPLLPVIDAAVVARRTSGLLLVARVGETDVGELETAAQSVRAVGADVLGIVVNRVSKRRLLPYKGYASTDGPRTTEHDHPDESADIGRTRQVDLT